jgi:hypothetical protein
VRVEGHGGITECAIVVNEQAAIITDGRAVEHDGSVAAGGGIIGDAHNEVQRRWAGQWARKPRPYIPAWCCSL